MSEKALVAVRTTPLRRLAEEWALVLVSQGLSPTLRRTGEGWWVGVPAEQAERAAAALADQERETRPVVAREATPLWNGGGALRAGLLVAAALLGVFLVARTGDREALWFAHGAADADRLLAGEPWRAVTALTLHVDAAHVVANALASSLFLPLVFQLLGPGLGGALVLLAGAGGNLANALLHGAGHASVGASTAVFGAVGLLGGSGIARRRLGGGRGRRTWLPLAASLALLAMLGTGGERTDIWAHGLGFCAGAALGLGVALRLRRPPPLAAQWAFGAAALGTVLGSWALAL